MKFYGAALGGDFTATNKKSNKIMAPLDDSSETSSTRDDEEYFSFPIIEWCGENEERLAATNQPQSREQQEYLKFEEDRLYEIMVRLHRTMMLANFHSPLHRSMAFSSHLSSLQHEGA